MKKYLLLVFLYLSISVKAQVWVTIPDNEFAHQLSLVLSSGINGNQIDITSSDVLTLDSLFIPFDNISDLSGIEYFSNLRYLNCSYNTISHIDSLPTSLYYFEITNNLLTTLPELPGGLQTLSCGGNQLPALPVLPGSLRQLNCSNNLLSSLPVLPDSLQFLNCVENQLTTLPFIPDSVLYLICYRNQLTQIPLNAFHNGLLQMNCDENLIASLPALPMTLEYLSCGHNLLTELPQLPLSLTGLNCSFNQLTCLPDLPDSLISIGCQNNLLTSLPVLPSTLESLNCAYNNISRFPILPNSLRNNYYILQLQQWNYYFYIIGNPIVCLPSRNGLASGQTDPQFPNGEPPICNDGDQDQWGEDCSTISVDAVDRGDELQLFPNPANTNLIFRSMEDIITCRILDLNGNSVGDFKVGKDKLINIQTLASGIYIAEIILNDKIFRKKIVIKK